MIAAKLLEKINKTRSIHVAMCRGEFFLMKSVIYYKQKLPEGYGALDLQDRHTSCHLSA